MSVALAVCGTIGLMAGAAVLMLAAARKLDPTGGWPSLIPLGAVLLAAGLGLGVAAAVVTSAGLRDGGRQRAGHGRRQAGTVAAGPGPLVAEPAAAAAPDLPSRPNDFVWAGDPPRPPEPAARPANWEQPAEPEPPAVDRGDDTRAEDWLSHLRGASVRPAHQTGRAASPERPVASPPSYAPPASFAPPASHAPPPADYADAGWQLDGSEAEGHGRQPPAPEIHHPAAGRRHDTGQQPAYDTGQWRAFGLDQPPPGRQA
jgi:hypothetical protein